MLIIALAVPLVFVLAVAMFLHTPSFGRLPSGKRLERVRQSPNYVEGEFRYPVKTEVMTSSKSGLAAMWEAAVAVCQAMDGGKKIAFVNVMNRLSVDCDCNANPAEPDMHDIGVLASLDPLALDQACIDKVWQAPDSKSLKARVDRQQGRHILEYTDTLGVYHRRYRLVNLDK